MLNESDGGENARKRLQELSIGQIRFKAFDLGGHEIARKVWKDYYAKVRSCRMHLEIEALRLEKGGLQDNGRLNGRLRPQSQRVLLASTRDITGIAAHERERCRSS